LRDDGNVVGGEIHRGPGQRGLKGVRSSEIIGNRNDGGPGKVTANVKEHRKMANTFSRATEWLGRFRHGNKRAKTV